MSAADDDTTVSQLVCAVCRVAEATYGVLCEGCRDEVVAPVSLLPQQILATIPQPTSDALIDQWGRVHRLEDRTLIGRALAGSGIMILEASVSRHHAHIARQEGGWRLRDLASVNGTHLNDDPIDSRLLAHGDRISIGAIPFYFATDVADVKAEEVEAAAITTVRTRESAPSLDRVVAIHIEETTDAGLPVIDFQVTESGGGAVAQIGSTSVQVSTNQGRLLALLASRMQAESQQPQFVRGFVRSSELVGALVWDSPDPDDNHVKQLVRRTRRQLAQAGMGELIEARQRFGYRLRLIPRS